MYIVHVYTWQSWETMAGGSTTSYSDLPNGLSQEPLPWRGPVRRKSHAPLGKYDEETAPIPDEQEEGPAPVTVRHVFEGLFHTSHHEHAKLVIKLRLCGSYSWYPVEDDTQSALAWVGGTCSHYSCLLRLLVTQSRWKLNTTFMTSPLDGGSFSLP